MFRKAVSPLISVMLVLVFTVSISTAILGWVTDYTKTTTDAATESATGTKGITYCANSNVEISNVALRNVQITSNTSVLSGDVNYFDLTSVSGTPTITFTGVSSGGSVTGLAGLWNFDEGSGTDALDSTSNNNDGIVTGATWNSSGYIGDALQFDGDDYVTVADDATLDMTSAVTLEVWVNVKDEPTAWHLDGWSKRQVLSIDSTVETLTDYQIKKTIAFDSDMQADFDDIRFTTTDGINIPYWIETKNSTSAEVWLKIPETSNTLITQIWQYYGNSGVSSVSNGGNVFEFYDDFNRADSGTVGNGWSQWANVVISDNRLKFTTDSTIYRSFDSRGYVLTADIENDVGYELNIYATGGTAANTGLSGRVSSAPYLKTRILNSLSELDFYSETISLDTVYTGELSIASNYATEMRSWETGVESRPTSAEASYGTLTPTDATQNIGLGVNTAAGYIHYADNFRVRKYTPNEPIWGIDGAEETRSPTEWHLDGWTKRQVFSIDSTVEVLTDYQIKKTIAFDSDMQADFDDLRFTTYNGGSISYWIESKNSTSADVWLNIPQTSTSESTNVWMYYGNSGVSNASDGINVFELFDDFNDGNINNTLWYPHVTGSATVTEANGILTLQGQGPKPGGETSWLESRPENGYAWDYNHRIRMKRWVLAESYDCAMYDFINDNGRLGFIARGSIADISTYSLNGGSSDLVSIGNYENAWHLWEVQREQSAAHFLIDDMLKYTSLPPYIPAGDMRIYESVAGSAVSMKIDWIFVGKYTANEPTWAADGLEETRSPTVWHLDGWNYRQLITVNKSQVSGINTNMPIGLSINISGANTGASDLRVYDTNGQQLAREIEMYENDKLMAWINVPNLTNTSDYQYYIYWGNSGATEPAADSTYGSQAVWDSNYSGVWHLNQEPNGAGVNSMLDSTSNENHGTPTGFIMNSLGDSSYAKAITFDSTNSNYIFMSDNSFDFSNHDFSIIIRAKSDLSGGDYILSHYDGTDGWFVNMMSTRIRLLLREVGSADQAYTTGSAPSSNTWHNMFHTVDISSSIGLLSRLDGGSDVIADPTTISNIDVTANLKIATDSVTYFDGIISDVRIINVTLSSNYISTTHKNLNNPSASGTAPFYKTFGAVETKSIVSKVGAYEISANSTHAIGRINDQTIIAAISLGWNHIALTYNQTGTGTEELILYVNSVESATADYLTVITTNTNDVIIGNNFNGTIDEVRIWNRELTQSEIATYYEQSNPSSAVSTLNPKASINGNANVSYDNTLVNGVTETLTIDSDNFTIGTNNITIYTDAGVVDYSISMNGLSALISNTGMNNVTVKQVVAFKSDGSNCILKSNETTFEVGDVFSVSGCPMSCDEFLGIKAYTDCTGVFGEFTQTPSGC
ncbi:DUF2341 domain-containing protein [archaeon]|nr:DUF2341 domain-containing protein [archaeon]